MDQRRFSGEKRKKNKGTGDQRRQRDDGDHDAVNKKWRRCDGDDGDNGDGADHDGDDVRATMATMATVRTTMATM